MDNLLACSVSWPNILLSALVLVLTVAVARLTKTKRRKPSAPLPPGPRRFPILGNLHNLANTEVPHQRLAELSKKHGPLMQLQLGQIPMVVVSSQDAARAILKTHDQNFADRPSILAAREVAYNCRNIAFSPYGDYWRTMKKISIVELLTAKRVAAFRHVRDAAVTMILDEVVRAGTEPVDLSKNFYVIGNWTVSRATFGSTKSEHHLDYIIEVMNEIVALASGMNLAEFFPSVESLISAVTGVKRKLRRIFLKMDALLDSIINEHMSRLETSVMDEQKDEDQDLLDLLLRHYRLQDLDFTLEIDNIKAVLLDLFIAGTDTSSSTLEWAMTEMMKNPEVRHKAQSEVRRLYQEKGKIDESIVDELSYLKLVIKETLRLHPPAPLLLPRECKETCEINGYTIPAKTRVVVNAWGLGRDPECWEKPNKFDPERFRDQSLDYRGTDYKYLPFGSGRRMCPGATFGIANIDITLAKILCHFDWKLPDGMGPEDLNMEETSGATVHKKFPLRLVGSLRIPLQNPPTVSSLK